MTSGLSRHPPRRQRAPFTVYSPATLKAAKKSVSIYQSPETRFWKRRDSICLLTSGASTPAVTTFPLVFKPLPVPPVLEVGVHVPPVGVAEHAGALRPPKLLPVGKSVALILTTVPEEVAQPRTFFSIANLDDESIENLTFKSFETCSVSTTARPLKVVSVRYWL